MKQAFIGHRLAVRVSSFTTSNKVQEKRFELLGRREFLVLLLLAMSAPAALADNGGSGGESDSDSGGDSDSDSGGDDGGDDGGGDSGDDGGESGSEHGGISNSGHGRNDQRKDWDRARNALKRGEVISLKQALGIVASRSDARVIDVSLRQGLFSRIYTFKLKDASGRISTLRMDARTGRIIGN